MSISLSERGIALLAKTILNLTSSDNNAPTPPKPVMPKAAAHQPANQLITLEQARQLCILTVIVADAIQTLCKS